MIRKRPASLLVIAILSMVVGLHWTCCGMFNLGVAFPWIPDDPTEVQDSRPQSEDQSALLAQPVLKIINWLRYVIELLISLSLFVLSVGLLQMRAWARPLLKVIAVLIILVCLAGFPLTYWQWQTDMGDAQNGPDEARFIAPYVVPIYVSEFFTLAILLAFGIGLLVVQRRADFCDAFRLQSDPTI